MNEYDKLIETLLAEWRTQGILDERNGVMLARMKRDLRHMLEEEREVFLKITERWLSWTQKNPIALSGCEVAQTIQNEAMTRGKLNV